MILIVTLNKSVSHVGATYALIASLLFGASTPFAKALMEHMAPQVLAGLLYAGSGLGLLALFLLRARTAPAESNHLERKDLPWLIGAILFGGILAPVLLMVGLAHTPASTASLLLNMEGVLTALLAWFVFKENYDRRIMLGMGFIIVGGVLLSWQQGHATAIPWSAIAIIGACLGWAIDNNLTRKVSSSDAVQIAGIKGLVAGIVNLGIAALLGNTMPSLGSASAAMLVGFCGYGVSLVLFVLALRHIGTARTGAYFSTAPFIGVIVAFVLLHESPNGLFWGAALFMGVGVWLHLSEHHEHSHVHEALTHSHSHTHDEHHQHTHDFVWNGKEPHVHLHRHERLEHSHAHFPDVHHQHRHDPT